MISANQSQETTISKLKVVGRPRKGEETLEI